MSTSSTTGTGVPVTNGGAASSANLSPASGTAAGTPAPTSSTNEFKTDSKLDKNYSIAENDRIKKEQAAQEAAKAAEAALPARNVIINPAIVVISADAGKQLATNDVAIKPTPCLK